MNSMRYTKRIAIITICILLVSMLAGCKQKTTNNESSDSDIQNTNSEQTTAPTAQPIKEATPTVYHVATLPPATHTPMPTHTPTPIPQPLTFSVEPIESKEAMEIPYMSKKDFPVLDGSTANIPLGEAIYSYLTKSGDKEAKTAINFHTTPDAYRYLMNGSSDILFVYEPSQTILQEMKDQNSNLRFKPLGRDALVFIANETNPVTSLTQEQIKQIYTGQITNWEVLGGKDQKIEAFQRPATSGSQTLMEKLAVSADVIMKGPEVVSPEDMGGLIDVLASYNNQSNAIGYSVFFYANYMYSKPGLKFLAIDGVMPDNKTIQSLEYPYVNDFYVVIRADEPVDSNARKLYDWMTTIKAQKLLADAGYVPVMDVDSEAAKEIDYSQIKTGSMKLKENQLLILHNLSSNATFTGDYLLDASFNRIAEFPGKYIDPEDSVTCQSDDILILKSYKKSGNDSYHETYFGYELYDLKTNAYLTDQAYDWITHEDDRMYVCTTESYYSDQVRTTVFTKDGTMIYDHISSGPEERDNSVTACKNYVLILENEVLTILDEKGTKVTSVSIPNATSVLSNNMYGSEQAFYPYAVVQLSDYSYVIYDMNGKRIDVTAFLKNYDKSVPKEPWITQLCLDYQGRLYAYGIVNSDVIVAREDGTILFQEKKAYGQYNSWLNPGIFSIYHETNLVERYYDVEGNLLFTNEDNPENQNNNYILRKEDKMVVYHMNDGSSYTIEEPLSPEAQLWITEYTNDSDIVEIEYEKENQWIKKVWYQNKMSWEEAGLYPMGSSYFTLNCYSDSDQGSYLMDDVMNKLYTFSEDDVLQGIIEGKQLYLLIRNGSYTEIKDLKGTVLYRIFNSNLVDD